MQAKTFFFISCVLLGTAHAASVAVVGTVVELTTGLGHVVYASLFLPNSTRFLGPRPGLVVAHGSGGVYASLTSTGYPQDMEREYEEWAELAPSLGYVTLFVDSYNPKSGRPPGKGNANAAHIRPYDLYAGNEYLRTRTDVNASDISALGISHGSTAVVSALEDSDSHITSLPFKAGVGYYACCGCGECNTNGFNCSDQKCGTCPSCPLCTCTDSRYCPYAPMLIFAASEDPDCKSGYTEGFNPGYGSDWGKNWCDNRIGRAMNSNACPLANVAHKFQMLTYNHSKHGFDYQGNTDTAPNNLCARNHSRIQTFNWIQNSRVDLDSPCAHQLYGI